MTLKILEDFFDNKKHLYHKVNEQIQQNMLLNLFDLFFVTLRLVIFKVN